MKNITFTKIISSANLTKSIANINPDEFDQIKTDILGPLAKFVKLTQIDSYFDMACRGERLEFHFIVIKEHEKRFNLLKAFL